MFSSRTWKSLDVSAQMLGWFLAFLCVSEGEWPPWSCRTGCSLKEL